MKRKLTRTVSRFWWVGAAALLLAPAPAAASARWSHIPLAGSPQSSLVSVSCPSPNACSAVGAGYAMRYDGRRFVGQRIATPVGGTPQLTAVACPTSRWCTAVGMFETRSVGTGSAALIENWSGGRWSVAARTRLSGSGWTPVLSGVSCTSTRLCVAAGYSDPPEAIPPAAGFRSALGQRWDGHAWSALRTGPARTWLNGVACGGPRSCVGVGASSDGTRGALALRGDGVRWSVRTPLLGRGSELRSVVCTSPRACTAVGADTRGAPVAARWGGVRWTAQRVPPAAGATDASLVDVACRSDHFCIAVGSQTPKRSTTVTGWAVVWRGTGWQTVSPPRPPAARDSWLTSVSCATGDRCVAVGGYRTRSGATRPFAARYG